MSSWCVMDPLQPGHVVDDFDVHRVLGTGGFADVYEVTEISTGRRAALKVLRPGADGEYEPRLRARFEREAALVGQLSSPHVVRMYGCGELSSGLLYAAFEYVEGEDLRDVLSRGRPEPEFVMLVLRQMLLALQEAHHAGLIHRDVKPENIRIAPGRHGAAWAARLLDFGIARSTDEGHPSLTKTGELIGTPRYMSPEQLTGAPLSAASDVYSLGLVIFEALTGAEAMPGNSWSAQIDRLQTGHLFSVEQMAAGARLQAVVRRMTARDSSERFQSAMAVLRALDRPEHVVPRPPGDGVPDRSRSVAMAWAVVAFVLLAVIYVATRDEKPRPVVDRARNLAGLVQVAPEGAGTAVTADVGEVADAARRADAEVPHVAWWKLLESGCGRQASPPGHFAEGRYRRFVPEGYDSDVPSALVVGVHTDARTGVSLLIDAGLEDVATREGFVVVTPYDDPLKRDVSSEQDLLRLGLSWRGDAQARLLFAVVRRAYQEFCIDPGRVFVFAQGAGVRAALAVSCQPWVAAVAMFGYGLPSSVHGRNWCDVPKPVNWIHPNDSEVVKTEPGTSCRDVDQLGVSRTARLWRKRNGCGKRSKVVVNESSGVCRAFECDMPFELCRVGGGVVLAGQDPWPGSPTVATGCRSERATEFPVIENAWRFFNAVAPAP